MNSGLVFRYFIVLLGALAVLWLIGLLLFVMAVQNFVEPVIDASMTPTEAIVVLTGGSERLTTGIELLKAGKGRKLFVSGVHPKLTLDKIFVEQAVPKELRECCIVLGHAAETTIGNADETMTWMAIENYHSLRLVTSNYHMPRSLLLFRNAMQDMSIIPHPVVPESVKLQNWWQRSGTASLLVTEYDKYLWAAARIWLGLA